MKKKIYIREDQQSQSCFFWRKINKCLAMLTKKKKRKEAHISSNRN